MRKFIDDKSWLFRTGQQISTDELSTAKVIMASYFGLEGKEDLTFKAWDNLSMKQTDARFSFYTAKDADSGLPFTSPKFANNVRQDTLKNYSLKILDTIALAADIDVKILVVTSTIRNSEDQARIMFNNIQAGKSAKYGEAGSAVVDTYNEHVKAGNSSSEIKSAMTDVIQQYADKGRLASNHQGDPTKLNVFDIAPSSVTKNAITAWQDALDTAMSSRSIDKYYGPNTRTFDPAYHLEIIQLENR